MLALIGEVSTDLAKSTNVCIHQTIGFASLRYVIILQTKFCSMKFQIFQINCSPHGEIKDLSILNSVPNDKILDQSNFKGFADDKINVTFKMNFVKGRVENSLGK